MSIVLTDEQKKVIELAKLGKNVLVDAVIGSGKTSCIQFLCDEISDKNILYLTYNKLLKVDAREKIKNKNVNVTNYHGYAYEVLSKNHIKSGQSDLIQNYINNKVTDNIFYDILVLDEYQDIDLEISQMLEMIKKENPNMQIIAVGDMCQKIYDKTSLNVPQFINKFLGENYEKVDFTNCFRISKKYGEKLGKIWGKTINGRNKNCKVEKMNIEDVVEYLSKKETSEILCLGSLTGDMIRVLNELEEEYPEKFNKNTVYAKIHEQEGGATSPTKDTAIFTTFDGSKGLERDTCIVFDYTYDYWEVRKSKPNVKYDILRNIFLVAGSRGKSHIIFAEGMKPIINDDELKQKFEVVEDFKDPFTPSEMFEYKFKEDVEECFNLIKLKEIPRENREVIDIKDSDGMIDLTPCIGIYQEASFFKNYSVKTQMMYEQEAHRDRIISYKKDKELEQYCLELVAFQTKQERYTTQVKTPFIELEDREKLHDRLSEEFKRDEKVQEEGVMYFKIRDKVAKISGMCDVIKNDIIYELKFSQELRHEQFLQCAMYIMIYGKKSIIWNTKNNKMYEITIPDKNKFMDAVVNCITKGVERKYVVPSDIEIENFKNKDKEMKYQAQEKRYMGKNGNADWLKDVPSDAQLNFIRRLERESGEEFTGKTKGEASRYISRIKEELGW